jgi:ribosome-binding protein aMBF1 (putative translation factor)
MIYSMELISHKEFHAELMKDPEYRRGYEALDFEFAIREALFNMRIKGDVTQAQLAERMGTKQSAIARFESGRSNPTLDFIQRLADALELELKVSVRKSVNI